MKASWTAAVLSATSLLWPQSGFAALARPGAVLNSVGGRARCVPADAYFGAFEPWMVFFDSGSARVTPQARLILENAATGFRQFPKCVLEVQGHIDAFEAASKAPHLDARRAKAVVHFLRRRGVTMRVIIKAYGDTRPLAEARKGAAEPQNRLVELNMFDPADARPVACNPPVPGGPSECPL